MQTLLDQKAVRDKITKAAHSITRDPRVVEDLVQNALLHFCLVEGRHPGHNVNWYLQGCRWYALDCLKKGSSLDSPKHKSMECPWDDEAVAASSCASWRDTDPLQAVCAHDALEQLCALLTPRERELLSLLLDGLHEPECAAQLHISQPAVSKLRHRICSVAIHLGIHR